MNWHRGKLIGCGSTAEVFLAKSLISGAIFAVKSIEVSKCNALRKEQAIHSSLNCDRIIKYHGCDVTIENGKTLYNIHLEYASGGPLFEAIKKYGGGLIEPKARRYTREILQGLEYLHSKGIVHCDIKGANILVTNEGVKIGDFGCCKRVDDVAGCDLSRTEICGTPMYMAPEVACGEEQSYPADVWALGSIVFEMLTGLSPWPNIAQDPVSALYHIGFSGALPEIPDFLSGQAKDFLSKCFKRDPKERWSVDELLKHPFVIEDGPAQELTFGTPTSILDQDIWARTMEITLSSPINVGQERSTKSPSERIRELMVSSRNECPNWALDGDWITVRRNGTYEGNSSGLGFGSAQHFQPNLICASATELTFPFPIVELLNCCNYIKNSMPSIKNINDIKSDLNCTCCMDVMFCSIKLVEDLLPAIFCKIYNCLRTFVLWVASLESIPYSQSKVSKGTKQCASFCGVGKDS